MAKRFCLGRNQLPKDKDEKDKHKEAKKADKTQPDNGASAGGATYSDGHPQDVVQYLEAKLILKPDRFVSVESFRDFGKLVQR